MLGCVTATYDVNEVGPNQLLKFFSVLLWETMPFAGAGYRYGFSFRLFMTKIRENQYLGSESACFWASRIRIH